MAYSNEQIQKAVAALPPEFQDALADSFIANKILEIGKRRTLNVEQIGKLHDITLLSVLGLIPGTRVGETLAQDLAVAPASAQQILTDINTEVFDGIKQKIRARMEAEALKKEETPTVETPSLNIEDHTTLDRDEILKGIEEPHPAVLKPAPIPMSVAAGNIGVLEPERKVESAPAPIPAWAKPVTPAPVATPIAASVKPEVKAPFMANPASKMPSPAPLKTPSVIAPPPNLPVETTKPQLPIS
ncbi:hypothetical protein KW797_04665, partial [Candidatus Parcubacteria bacterium]|nr:hypothetical protein [Candidatus Parcubacteria bacterium]